MKILFKVENVEGKKVVKALFPSADSCCRQTGLHTIIKAMKDLLPEDKKEDVKFISLYAGDYEFNDNTEISHKHDFYALVRMKDGIPDEILDVNEREQWKLLELLNKENKDKNIAYWEFKISGELKEWKQNSACALFCF